MTIQRQFDGNIEKHLAEPKPTNRRSMNPIRRSQQIQPHPFMISAVTTHEPEEKIVIGGWHWWM
ncbi:MAG: hypothetical protein AAGA73_16285, partial [Pseudomonadota bacterium]